MRWAMLAILMCAIAPALAEPPPGADSGLAPWFQSLVVPGKGSSCCGIADCRYHEVRFFNGGYQVLGDANDWLDVPESVIIRDVGNPTGRWVACLTPDYLPPPKRVICFIPQPGT